MKRKCKTKKVLGIILLTALTIICTCLVLRRQYQSRIDSIKISQRQEVTDKNIADSIDLVLLTVFKGYSALDMDEFHQKYYCGLYESFVDDRVNNIVETTYSNLFNHIYNQIDENNNRENIRTNIKLEKLYDLGNKNYEAEFFVDRKFNIKNDPTVIKIREHYCAKLDYSSNKFLISELYDIDDFNHYLDKHKISEFFYTKQELIPKYLEYKRSVYHDLDERYIHKDWFDRSGYKY